MTPNDYQEPRPVFIEQPRQETSAVKITLIVVAGLLLLCGLCGLISIVGSAVAPDRSPYTPAPTYTTPVVPHTPSR